MSNRVLSLIIFLSLFGCGKEIVPVYIVQKEVKEQNPNKDQGEVSINNNSKGITIERFVKIDDNFHDFIQLKENLNKYTIQAKINKKSNLGEYLKCVKLTSGVEKSLEIVNFVKGSSSARIDFEIKSDDDNKFEIDCMVSNEDGETLEAITLTVLKDFLISGDSINIRDTGLVIGNSINEIGILFLDHLSTLSVKNLRLNINATAFVARDATIISFDENNLIASDGKNGLNGGVVNINAQKSFGKISFVLRGQNGGKVHSKFSGRASDGARGSSGTDEIARCQFGGSVPTLYRKACPTLGESGKNGAHGADGTDGKNGGNSGKFSLKISQMSELEVYVDNRVGKGSAGVPGQVGGEGGQPGTHGKYLKITGCSFSGARSCPRYKPTYLRSGLAGRNGRDGINGIDGHNFESIFINGDKRQVY